MTEGQGPLVLVVDDEAKNLQVVGALLRERGFRVAIAMEGHQALAIAVESQPDAILLDVMMPGMDGLEVCRALRRDIRTAGIPVLFLTARTSEEDVVAGFAAGGVDYVPKPFRPEELIARVTAHAQLRRMRGLLYVCAHCQRIRNEERSWERLESYVAHHTDATFSHGVCPDCLARYFPGVDVSEDLLK